jgi:hypothetical protein
MMIMMIIGDYMVRKIVKITFRKNPPQCVVTIPRIYWHTLPESGFFYVNEENGSLIYTPADVKSRAAQLPPFVKSELEETEQKKD